jgi:hypothetical protein
MGYLLLAAIRSECLIEIYLEILSEISMYLSMCFMGEFERRVIGRET